MSTPLEPFKIVGQLVGVVRDEEGEIVGEKIIGEVAIYAAQFGQVEELISKAIEEAGDVG